MAMPLTLATTSVSPGGVAGQLIPAAKNDIRTIPTVTSIPRASVIMNLSFVDGVSNSLPRHGSAKGTQANIPKKGGSALNESHVGTRVLQHRCRIGLRIAI